MQYLYVLLFNVQCVHMTRLEFFKRFLGLCLRGSWAAQLIGCSIKLRVRLRNSYDDVDMESGFSSRLKRFQFTAYAGSAAESAYFKRYFLFFLSIRAACVRSFADKNTLDIQGHLRRDRRQDGKNFNAHTRFYFSFTLLYFILSICIAVSLHAHIFMCTTFRSDIYFLNLFVHTNNKNLSNLCF